MVKLLCIFLIKMHHLIIYIVGMVAIQLYLLIKIRNIKMVVITIRNQYGNYQIRKLLHDFVDGMIQNFYNVYGMSDILVLSDNHCQIRTKQLMHFGHINFFVISILKLIIMIGQWFKLYY